MFPRPLLKAVALHLAYQGQRPKHDIAKLQLSISRWLEQVQLGNVAKVHKFTQDTIECRYNAVHYNMMLHASLQWRMRNINRNLNTQKSPHVSP